MSGANPFDDDAARTFRVGPGTPEEPGTDGSPDFDPMHVHVAAEEVRERTRAALRASIPPGPSSPLAAYVTPLQEEEEEARRRREAEEATVEQGKDIAGIIAASNMVADPEEGDAASLAINSVAAQELVDATSDATTEGGVEGRTDHAAIVAANNARAAAAREESVAQELKMLENLMLQELEVKRKLDGSFQSRVAEEMAKSKAAIEEAKARERQLKVRELELEVRLEKQMREQNAQLTSASAELTRQMSETARQQQKMASEALKSAAAAQAAALEASRGSVAKAIDYVKNKNVTAAMERIRAVRAKIAETIRSKEALKTNLAMARDSARDKFSSGYESVQTSAEAARPVIVKLAEHREAMRNKIHGMRDLTLEHKRLVDEKFSKVMAPRLQAMSDNSGLSLVDGSTLTNAHKALSTHVAGALKGYNIEAHGALAELIAFLAMLLPLVGWVVACGYMLYRAVQLGYSSLPSMVYYGNMFWCAYFGVLLSIVMLLGQEPLADFHHSHPEDYLVFQFLKAALFVVHFLLCVALAALSPGYATVAHVGLVGFVMTHYYNNAWVLAMMDHPPKLGLMSYLLYVWIFGMMLSMPRSKMGQKLARE